MFDGYYISNKWREIKDEMLRDIDLAEDFFEDGTKEKIPFEIKPPLF